MPKVFYALLFCLPIHLSAQAPWSNVPTTVDWFNFESGTDTKLRLKLDTLVVQDVDSNDTDFILKYVLQTWYSGETKFGYGYVTSQGLPIGVWQYYVKRDSGYVKVCEGSYSILRSINLEIDKRFENNFSSTEVDALKANWLALGTSGWLFTGEWRFYENGQLRKIVLYDDKVVINLHEVIEGDKEYIVSGQSPYLGRTRPSGKFQQAINFTKDGSVEAIRGGINLDFKEGKPILEPLFLPPSINIL